jgi:hypothetical protein
MRSVALILLFIGMFLVIQGYYSQANFCPPQEVAIKYVPRSVYDDQLSPDNQDVLSKQFVSLFEQIQPWPGVQQPVSIEAPTRVPQ